MRPHADEVPEYYVRYVNLVPDGDIIDILESQIHEALALVEGLDDESALYRYQAGKWSVKEVLGHLIDCERVFACRALRFGRGDETSLPGFDQDAYVAAGKFDRRPLSDLLQEFLAVRRATVALFRGFGEEEMQRRGVANEVPVSVRAIAYIIAGHERHHRTILRERYLPAIAKGRSQ